MNEATAVLPTGILSGGDNRFCIASSPIPLGFSGRCSENIHEP